MSTASAGATEAIRRRSRKAAGGRRLLQITLISLLIFPSYMVLAPVGHSGSVAQLLALALFALWAVSAILGLHQPAKFGHPGRPALFLLIVASCASYASLHAGLSGLSTVVGRSAADRWMLLLLAMAGICFVTTESLRTITDALAVIRWVIAGGTFCCIAAIGQFATHANPVTWLTPLMLGFIDTAEPSPFQVRGDFMRVWGTALHPIELGVISSMLLPLAVWRAIHDHNRGKMRKCLHWLAVVLFFLTIVMTVSRSGLISLAIAVVTLTPFLSRQNRKWLAFAIFATVAALYVVSPRLINTIIATASAGVLDDSVAYRADDYPLVVQLVTQRPWFGSGPGTWIPVASRDILDNGYLFMAVTTGVIGLVALLLYMVVPPLSALRVARGATTPELTQLAASAAAGGFIAAVATGTFDSLSFPTFALLSPFFVGLAGACWRIHTGQKESAVLRTAPARKAT
ncbi:MAG: hypothetical protein JWQ56_3940 [Pseudarthrobacter sp.]|nr:hypothetical protein [Pseudarthrobacter sp.]